MDGPPPTRAELQALLREYNEYPDRRERVLQRIQGRFSQHLAILVLDSSGFSRTTRGMGIVHFLALLERLERTVRPIVDQHNGRVLRTEADNIFAVFPTADDALACALRIQQSLAAANELLPAAEEIYASIGVGFGPVLAVGDDDVYGDEMNLACKLGEDLADRGEILLTTGAKNALRSAEPTLEEVAFSVSGLAIPGFRVVY